VARWGIKDPVVWKTLTASVAPNTFKAYQNVFNSFLEFMEEKSIDFNSLAISHVLSFCQTHVGKSASRCRTIMAAVKFFLKIYRRPDLESSPLLLMFVKGAQNLAPLPVKKSFVWDPNILLNFVKSRERPTLFLDRAKEALVLFLLATGLRIDDVWKLSCDFVSSNDAYEFPFVAKRKCLINGKHSLVQSVKRFVVEPRICPISAIEHLFQVDRTCRVSGDNALFISSTGKRASKDTLRRWVSECLKNAGIIASAGSCRSAVTSSAFANACPVDTLLKSAGWSSESTFRRFYHRAIVTSQPALNLLEWVA
jgi:site-specific recombinase XerD